MSGVRLLSQARTCTAHPTKIICIYQSRTSHTYRTIVSGLQASQCTPLCQYTLLLSYLCLDGCNVLVQIAAGSGRYVRSIEGVHVLLG